MIPEHTAQAIKEAAKIADVVDRFVDLKKSGSRYRGLCPFHNERTPSFYVTPSRNIFKCFGCGEGGDAVSFLMKHKGLTYPEALRYLAEMYDISIEDKTASGEQEQRSPKPSPRPTPPPPPPPDFIPKAVFLRSLKEYEHNNFVALLRTRFGNAVAAEMIGRYPVGTSKKKWPRAVVFWYLDTSNHVRYGKVVPFYPDRLNRIPKEDGGGVTAAHTLLRLSGNFSPCWYGEHLLPKRPAAPVGMVESEKAAILASLYLPGYVWLAAGGQDGIFDLAKWETLKGRRVVLFPDADPPDPKTGKSPFTRWSEHAERLRKLGYKVTVSDLLESDATPEDRTNKYDLADYLLNWEPETFRAAQEAQTAPPQPAPSQGAHERAAAPSPMPQPPTAPQPVAPGVPSGWQRIERQNEHGDTVRTWLDADGLPADWSEENAAALAALDTDTEPRPYQSQIDLCERYGFTFTGQSKYNPAKDDGLLDRGLERMERHRAVSGYTGEDMRRQRFEQWPEVLDIIRFFEAKPINQPFHLNGQTKVENPQKFVEAHLETVKSNNGNPAYRPYLENLIAAKTVLEAA